MLAYNINEIELESQSQTETIINPNDINCNGNNPHAYTAKAKAKINKACSAFKRASLLILSDVSNGMYPSENASCVPVQYHINMNAKHTAWRVLIASE